MQRMFRYILMIASSAILQVRPLKKFCSVVIKKYSKNKQQAANRPANEKFNRADIFLNKMFDILKDVCYYYYIR